MASTLANEPAQSPYPSGDQRAYTTELCNIGSADYTPAVPARGFCICGTTGAVKIDDLAGNTVVIPSGLLAGVIHPIGFKKMYMSGTTATNVVAFG